VIAADEVSAAAVAPSFPDSCDAPARSSGPPVTVDLTLCAFCRRVSSRWHRNHPLGAARRSSTSPTPRHRRVRPPP